VGWLISFHMVCFKQGKVEIYDRGKSCSGFCLLQVQVFGYMMQEIKCSNLKLCTAFFQSAAQPCTAHYQNGCVFPNSCGGLHSFQLTVQIANDTNMKVWPELCTSFVRDGTVEELLFLPNLCTPLTYSMSGASGCVRQFCCLLYQESLSTPPHTQNISQKLSTQADCTRQQPTKVAEMRG
jgi:hypothetical protein